MTSQAHEINSSKPDISPNKLVRSAAVILLFSLLAQQITTACYGSEGRGETEDVMVEVIPTPTPQLARPEAVVIPTPDLSTPVPSVHAIMPEGTPFPGTVVPGEVSGLYPNGMPIIGGAYLAPNDLYYSIQKP